MSPSVGDLVTPTEGSGMSWKLAKVVDTLARGHSRILPIIAATDRDRVRIELIEHGSVQSSWRATWCPASSLRVVSIVDRVARLDEVEQCPTQQSER